MNVDLTVRRVMQLVVRWTGICFSVLGAIGFLIFGLLYFKYHSESETIKQIAKYVTDGLDDAPRERLIRLTHWVYSNKGFAKNREYFLFSKLGPTPIQVLEKGGDCADKSRLLASMLYQLDIPNTLVMLYDEENGKPTHTVVEVRLPDFRAVADPVYDIVYTTSHGQFLGLDELRRNNQLFLDRLQVLVEERGEKSKVAFYKKGTESYQWPRTINWESKWITSQIGRLLAVFVDEPQLISRPRFLEEPVLLMSLISLSISIVMVMTGAGLYWSSIKIFRHKNTGT